jgi:hypothetical protein
MFKKLALVLVLGVSSMACRAQVHVQAVAATPIAEPAPVAAPPPAPEMPKVG